MTAQIEPVRDYFMALQGGICAALETIGETNLSEWCEKQLGSTLTVQRRKLLNGTKTG